MCKTAIKSLGPTRKDDCIIRCARALGTIYSVLSNFDEENRVAGYSESHSPPPFEEEVKKIIIQLQHANVLTEFQERKHSCFPRPKNILHAQPQSNVLNYILEHVIAAH